MQPTENLLLNWHAVEAVLICSGCEGKIQM